LVDELLLLLFCSLSVYWERKCCVCLGRRFREIFRISWNSRRILWNERLYTFYCKPVCCPIDLLGQCELLLSQDAIEVNSPIFNEVDRTCSQAEISIDSSRPPRYQCCFIVMVHYLIHIGIQLDGIVAIEVAVKVGVQL